MVHMEIIDLKIFKSVANEGKLTKAAKKLAMTQPGVSQHLKRLEDELGAQLFDRRKNRLHLNDFGRALLGRIEPILEGIEQLKSLSIDQIEPSGTLKLGLTDASTQTIVPPRLKAFHDKFPKVHVELIISDSDDIEDGVIRGRYDVGIISGMEISHPLVEEHVLDSDRIDCLVPKGNPLAGQKKVTLEELMKWPLIVYPRKSRTRQIIDKVLREKGLVPKQILDVWSNSASVRMAETGLGIALLSRYMIQSELIKHKCKHLRIVGDPFKRNICVIRKKESRLSEAAYQFYKLLIRR